MSGAKTTWEDLARLGFPSGTMHSFDGLALNDGFAAENQCVPTPYFTAPALSLALFCVRWWSYNTTIGEPYVISRIPQTASREKTAWTYDNSLNPNPIKDSWSQSWSDTHSATLSITSSGVYVSKSGHLPFFAHTVALISWTRRIVTISLSETITMFNVVSSSFDMSISRRLPPRRSSKSMICHTWELE